MKKDGHSLKEKLPGEYAEELALKGADEFTKEVNSIISKELIIDKDPEP